jgi:hypothetical protein
MTTIQNIYAHLRSELTEKSILYSKAEKDISECQNGTLSEFKKFYKIRNEYNNALKNYNIFWDWHLKQNG